MLHPKKALLFHWIEIVGIFSSRFRICFYYSLNGFLSIHTCRISTCKSTHVEILDREVICMSWPTCVRRYIPHRELEKLSNVMETGPLLLYRYLSVPSKFQGCNRVESCRAFPKKIITLRSAFETPNIPKLCSIYGFTVAFFFFYQRITLLRNRQLNSYAKITDLSSSYLLINSFGLSICATHITLGLVGMPSYPYLFSVVQISR